MDTEKATVTALNDLLTDAHRDIELLERKLVDIDAVLAYRASRIAELTVENERWVERIKQLEAKLSLVRTVVDGH